MNRNYFVRALSQSVISAVIAAIIFIVIFEISSRGSGSFIQGTLVVAGITFVVALLIHIIYGMLFAKRVA
jgi:hypothetical protein